MGYFFDSIDLNLASIRWQTYSPIPQSSICFLCTRMGLQPLRLNPNGGIPFPTVEIQPQRWEMVFHR